MEKKIEMATIKICEAIQELKPSEAIGLFEIIKFKLFRLLEKG